MHYTTLDFYHRSAEAVNHGWDLGRHWSKHPLNPLSYTPLGRFAEAFFESGERLTRRYEKPKFGLDRVRIDGGGCVCRHGRDRGPRRPAGSIAIVLALGALSRAARRRPSGSRAPGPS